MPSGGMLPNAYRTYYRLPRPDLQCSFCSRSFSRPSHLRRHNLIHLPPSRRRTITCEKCGSTFSRRDVLFRHMKGAHGLEYVAPTSQQRSCHRCVRKKIKCDRQTPCSGCTKSKDAEPCEYPAVEELYDQGFQPGFQISEDNLESLEATHVDHTPSKPSTQNETCNLAMLLSRGPTGTMTPTQSTHSELASSLTYHSPENPPPQTRRHEPLPAITEYPMNGTSSPQNDRSGFSVSRCPTVSTSVSRNGQSDFTVSYAYNPTNGGPSTRNGQPGLLPRIIDQSPSTSTYQRPDYLPPVSPPTIESTASTRHYRPDFTHNNSTNSMAIRQTDLFNAMSSNSNRQRSGESLVQDDQSDFATSPETISGLSQPIDSPLLENKRLSTVFSAGPPFAEDTTVNSSSLNDGFQFDTRFSGFDWLNLDVPDIDLANLISEGSAPTSIVQPGQPSDDHVTLAPTVQQWTSEVHWPFEQDQGLSSTRCFLPLLRDLLSGSLQCCSSTRTAALEGLVKILSEQRLPGLEDVMDSTALMGCLLIS